MSLTTDMKLQSRQENPEAGDPEPCCEKIQLERFARKLYRHELMFDSKLSHREKL